MVILKPFSSKNSETQMSVNRNPHVRLRNVANTVCDQTEFSLRIVIHESFSDWQHHVRNEYKPLLKSVMELWIQWSTLKLNKTFPKLIKITALNHIAKTFLTDFNTSSLDDHNYYDNLHNKHCLESLKVSQQTRLNEYIVIGTSVEIMKFGVWVEIEFTLTFP